jgi:hypothetical protein
LEKFPKSFCCTQKQLRLLHHKDQFRSFESKLKGGKYPFKTCNSNILLKVDKKWMF